MNWERATGLYYRHKIEENERKKKLKLFTSSNNVSSPHPRRRYNTINGIQVPKMVNLLHEFEGLSISVVPRNVTLP